MKLVSAHTALFTMAVLAGLHAQQGPPIFLPQIPPPPWHWPEKKTEPPLEPRITQPRAGEVVAGDLRIAASVSPKTRPRAFAIEAAYWDAHHENWVPVGQLCPEFPGDTTPSVLVPADVRIKLKSTATRWKIHVRVTNPPGHWGPWREFSWLATEPPKWPTGKPVK